MIGIDIVEIKRVEKLWNRWGEKFVRRVFSATEQKELTEEDITTQKLAGRYAAKEAIVKSMELGMGKMGIREIEILRSSKGGVYGIWKGNRFLVSISHEKDYAVAIAKKINFHKKENIPQEMLEIFPYPKEDDHKGSRGKIGMVSGREGMIGAAILSAQSAMRTGAGYCFVFCTEEISRELSLRLTEPILQPFQGIEQEKNELSKMDSIGIGPGLGTDSLAKERLENAMDCEVPLVIDADGLNLLSKDLHLLRKRKNATILTPHEMEMSRLSGIPVEEIRKNREKIAKDFAKNHQVVLVLKGSKTLVTDGEKIYKNKTGNPGMATAGSGDVLLGVISTFLGQGLTPFDAARLGVYVHGLAGDLAKEEFSMNGMIASDFVNFLPKTLKMFYP